MCTIAVRSVRYSTLPAFDSSTALATSIVTVPTLGFGILPWGPRMRPSRPTTGIMSGVAIAMSKSVKPSSCTRVARSSAPTKSAPASSASRALSPLAKTAIVTSLPSPCGSAIVPRSCSSAWRTLSPVRTCTSTVSSNFARLLSLIRRTASCGEYSRSRSIRSRASAYLRPCLVIYASAPRARGVVIEVIEPMVDSGYDVDAHRARGAGDDLGRLLDVVGVQVGELLLGDLADLVLRDRADLGAVRLA